MKVAQHAKIGESVAEMVDMNGDDDAAEMAYSLCGCVSGWSGSCCHPLLVSYY